MRRQGSNCQELRKEKPKFQGKKVSNSAQDIKRPQTKGTRNEGHTLNILYDVIENGKRGAKSGLRKKGELRFSTGAKKTKPHWGEKKKGSEKKKKRQGGGDWATQWSKGTGEKRKRS